MNCECLSEIVTLKNKIKYIRTTNTMICYQLQTTLAYLYMYWCGRQNECKKQHHKNENERKKEKKNYI